MNRELKFKTFENTSINMKKPTITKVRKSAKWVKLTPKEWENIRNIIRRNEKRNDVWKTRYLELLKETRKNK